MERILNSSLLQFKNGLLFVWGNILKVIPGHFIIWSLIFFSLQALVISYRYWWTKDLTYDYILLYAVIAYVCNEIGSQATHFGQIVHSADALTPFEKMIQEYNWSTRILCALIPTIIMYFI